MKRTLVRRLSAAVIVPALTFGTLAATTQTAHAEADTVPSTTGSAWLAANIPATIPLSGASLDAFIAFNALEQQATKAAAIVAAFAADPEAYITGESFGDTGSLYAGPIGKLATVVKASGGTPADFGGRNLITDLEGRTIGTGDETGRATDLSSYGDNSNTTGQSFVVRALKGADSAEATAAVNYLLKQQCEDGSFRINMFADGTNEFIPAADRTCGDATTSGDDQISLDATSAAGIALLEAGKSAEATKAADWLEEKQNADGSFTEEIAGEQVTNSNSTGLAGYFLAKAGATDPAEKAASWIVSNQVKAPAPSTLTDEVGAIAYTPTDYANAVSDGIVPGVRAQWMRSTSQALLATSAAQKLTVTVSAKYVKGGSPTPVTVAGLPANGEFTVVVGGVTTPGTANASGVGSVSVTPPASTYNRAVVATSTTKPRKGTATLKVLGPKTLAPKFAASSVKVGKTQKVTVSGLAPSEPVSVKYSTYATKTGTASLTGTYSYTFKVGSKKGTKTVKVTGAFINRTGSKTFTVK